MPHDDDGSALALYPPLPADLPEGMDLTEAPAEDDYGRILETICGTTDDSQEVEQYNGSLGVSIGLVRARQSAVGVVQWNANLATIYTNPGNVAGVRWGSGTLISPNLFLTAGHLFDQAADGWQLPRRNGTNDVIPSTEIATNMRVGFNFQRDPAGNLRPEQTFAIAALVEFRLGGLDFAIVRLAGDPGMIFGTGQLAARDAVVNDMACIIGHPAGRPKRIEAGPITQVTGSALLYGDIDTLGGNSGSGVLRSPDGALVGVHTNGGCHSSGGANRGVRIGDIRNASPTIRSLRRYRSVYAQGDPGNGIGGFDLKSSADRAFAFDYARSGKLDHIALYRPGTGTMWILKNQGGTFSPVYAQGDPGNGIGGFDLKSSADRAFAFDYDRSGKLDHIALYRPGTGTMWILKNQGGTFSPVYAQGDPGNGIGGFDLKSSADRAFAFDYDRSGKLDHIALYRPGTGTMWILKNQGGTFSPVYAQGDPGNGIGGFDLKSSADRAFAFDYDRSGKLDHIALYRPGTGTMWILRNQGGTFSPVYHQGDPGNGIGGYDLARASDRAFAVDYSRSGRLDHIALYRPGTGTMWILANHGGQFGPVQAEGDPGAGLGDYDLRSTADRAFAFDYSGSGALDHIALYRPGTGTMWIVRRS